jgi:hypothetical protein
MILTEPDFLDLIFKRSTVPKKMKSKLAHPWSADFRLILQASEKRIGFKS